MARLLASTLIFLLIVASLAGAAQASSPAITTTLSAVQRPAATLSPVTRTLSVADGGQVQLGNVTVNVPPHVLEGQTEITATLGLFDWMLRVPVGMVVGTSFELTMQDAQGQPITQLARPLDIRVQVTDSELTAAGGDTGNLIMGVVNEATNTWTRIPSTSDAAARTVGTQPDHLTKFSVLSVIPKARLDGPDDGLRLADMAPLFRFALAPGMIQYQLQVLPANGDGPAVNLIRNAESSFLLPAPALGQGNYVLLPDMTYTWRVRATPLTASITEAHPSWGPWEARTFRTPAASSGTITPVQPPDGAQVDTRTPALTWADQNAAIFYYEVQLSADPSFETGPAQASAAVYWNLVHGGQTTPLNTYALPTGFQLAAASRYYWRVRPRVQGDGVPVAWSATWSFTTP
jgi:hypothetical protein